MLIKRQKQVNSLIQKEVAEIIEKEIELPQSSFVTISQVKVRSDLNECQIGITIFPEKEEENVYNLIKVKKGMIQSILSKKFVMKKIPKISFYLDKSSQKAEHIEELLDSLKKEE